MRFRTVRQEAGLSRKELARQWGFSVAQIGAVERGERNPGVEFRALAEDFSALMGSRIEIREWPVPGRKGRPAKRMGRPRADATNENCEQEA